MLYNFLVCFFYYSIFLMTIWVYCGMRNTILNDLLYTICESYLDDILVYWKTKEELSKNLHSVISRLQRWGMTVKPKFHSFVFNFINNSFNFLTVSINWRRRRRVFNSYHVYRSLRQSSFYRMAFHRWSCQCSQYHLLYPKIYFRVHVTFNQLVCMQFQIIIQGFTARS